MKRISSSSEQTWGQSKLLQFFPKQQEESADMCDYLGMGVLVHVCHLKSKTLQPSAALVLQKQTKMRQSLHIRPPERL